MAKWKEYEWITTASKKVGGPKNLISLFIGGGALAGAGIKALIDKVRNKTKKEKISDAHTIYKITKTGKINDKCELTEGTTFAVLGRDEDAVVIVIEQSEETIVAKYEMLINISDYKIDDKK